MELQFSVWTIQHRLMSKVRQIDYKTPRTLRSLDGKRIVQLTGRDRRYTFEGVLLEGEESDHVKIGETHRWMKNAFPLPWSDDPDHIE